MTVIHSKYVDDLEIDIDAPRGQFPGARNLTPDEVARNRRLGILFEDIVGSETGVINVPEGSKYGHAEQLERGSALGLLKSMGKIQGFIDQRAIEPTVREHYKQERIHNKPDFWVLLVNSDEVEVEVKNFAKKPKDHPKPGYPTWFTRTLPQARDDVDKDWNPRAKRILALSYIDLYTPKALDYLQSERTSLVEAGTQATELSDFSKVRNYLAIGLYELFLGWVAA